jgi:hypothetical protein
VAESLIMLPPAGEGSARCKHQPSVINTPENVFVGPLALKLKSSEKDFLI